MRQTDHRLIRDADMWPLYEKGEGDISKLYKAKFLITEEQRAIFFKCRFYSLVFVNIVPQESRLQELVEHHLKEKSYLICWKDGSWKRTI